MKEEYGLKKHTDMIDIYIYREREREIYIHTSTGIKIHKTKFKAGCSYIDCNQFQR